MPLPARSNCAKAAPTLRSRRSLGTWCWRLNASPNLEVLHAPGTVLAYLAFNTARSDSQRCAGAAGVGLCHRPNGQSSTICCAILRGRPTAFFRPRAGRTTAMCRAYDHDPERARQLLEQAGYPAVNGVRFHLTMKTSTEESTRLMAAVLQQQLREVGIALDIRTFEFATFFSDVIRGAYQLHSLRWVGGNEDPDIFEYVFHSAKFSPNGANRTYYANPRVDALIDQARGELDQNTRKQIYAEIQLILAEDLPYINLWYFENVMVHTRRVRNLTLNPPGNYDFLKTAELAP